MQYSEWSRLLKADSRGMCFCPSHSDDRKSLKISDGKDKILMRCFAGCSTESIVEAVGCKMSDLFYNNDSGGGDPDDKWMRYVEGRTKKQIEAIYHHTDADGNYICTKIRLRPKDFRYGILKDGHFTFGLGGKKRKSIKAFYCKDLTRLKQAVADGDVVYVVEGEKDVDTLFQHGLIGMTCGSVSDWCKGVADVLQGASVVILADNDKPGIDVARRIQRDLNGIASKVRLVVPTPDLEHGDVSDYLQNHTVEDLKKLISNSFHPPSLTEPQAVALSKSVNLDLILTEKGKVASIFANYCRILDEDNYLKGKFRLNLMSNRPEVQGVFWNPSLHDVEDADYGHVRRYVSAIYGISNRADINQALNLAAYNNPYHPVRDLLNSMMWDGVKRIDNLFPRYLGAEKSQYTAVITRLMFASLIMRVFQPGIKFDPCFILADTKQGTGKSTMCRFLALRDEWFTDEVDSMDDKKSSFEFMSGKWVVELGELVATRRAKEIEVVKAFVSRATDRYRTPYGITPKDYPRQAIFIGTTNRPEFLPPDPTGNRRFLPIMLDGDKAEVHPLDDEEETRAYILQCFAEAMDYRKKQGDFSLKIPSMITEYVAHLQEQGTPDDSRVGMIQEWLDHTGEEAVCSRMIWDNVFSSEDRPIVPKKIDLSEISDIMNLQIKGWNKYQGKGRTSKKKIGKYGSQRAWVRQPKVDTGNPEDEGFIKINVKEEDLPFD